MGWKFFREIARPFEQGAHGLGLSGGGLTRTIPRETNRILRAPGVWTQRGLYQGFLKITGSEKNAAALTSAGDPVSMFTLFQPATAEEVGARDATLYRKGRQAGIWTSASIAALYAAWIAAAGGAGTAGGAGASEVGTGTSATFGASAVEGQSGAIAALSAAAPETAAPVATGLELEAAAGSMTVTEGFDAAAAGSSILSQAIPYTIPAMVASTVSATVSKLLTKAVDTVINPLFAPPSKSSDLGGGGGGGGSAGGYPFAMTGPSQTSADTMRLYLVAAALAALLVVAVKQSRKG